MDPRTPFFKRRAMRKRGPNFSKHAVVITVGPFLLIHMLRVIFRINESASETFYSSCINGKNLTRLIGLILKS